MTTRKGKDKKHGEINREALLRFGESLIYFDRYGDAENESEIEEIHWLEYHAALLQWAEAQAPEFRTMFAEVAALGEDEVPPPAAAFLKYADIMLDAYSTHDYVTVARVMLLLTNIAPYVFPSPKT